MVTIGIFVAATAMQRDQASAVLARSLVMLDKASSVVGVFTQKTLGQSGLARGEFRLKKDAMLSVSSRMNSEICDGIMRTSIDRVKGTYTVKDVRVFELPYLPGFEGFTMTNGKSLVDKFKMEANQVRANQPDNARMERLDGKSVVAYSVGGSNVFLDPESAMPVGADFVGENNKRVSMRFENVKTNVTLSDNMFAFSGQERMMEQQVIERGMLRVGQRYPISNIESMTMLSKAMAGKRSSIVVFFDDKNAPSGEMIQKMHQIAKKGPKDIAIIGVARTKNSWRKMFSGSLNFTVIEDAELSQDSIRSMFGITKYPTLYVIDHQSEATYVQIGSNDGELNPILRGLGFSVPQR
jgi:outer membrane lipoprotein-sorting protein